MIRGFFSKIHQATIPSHKYMYLSIPELPCQGLHMNGYSRKMMKTCNHFPILSALVVTGDRPQHVSCDRGAAADCTGNPWTQ